MISKTAYKDIKSFFEALFGPNFNSIKNFKVPSVLFLFGPSGSGKNSTIDVLCNMFKVEKITPKDIELNDIDDAELEEVRDIDYSKDLLKSINYSIFWYNPQ